MHNIKYVGTSCWEDSTSTTCIVNVTFRGLQVCKCYTINIFHLVAIIERILLRHRHPSKGMYILLAVLQSTRWGRVELLQAAVAMGCLVGGCQVHLSDREAGLRVCVCVCVGR